MALLGDELVYVFRLGHEFILLLGARGQPEAAPRNLPFAQARYGYACTYRLSRNFNAM
jgi:hypothetical protein